MFLNETKPSLDDALEHFGVKGMKWGVRNSSPRSSSRSRPSKSEIKSARAARKAGRADIKRARENLKKAKDNYKNMPEKEIARYLTRGERAATGVLVVGASVGIVALSAKSGKTSPVKTLPLPGKEGFTPAH